MPHLFFRPCQPLKVVLCWKGYDRGRLIAMTGIAGGSLLSFFFVLDFSFWFAFFLVNSNYTEGLTDYTNNAKRLLCSSFHFLLLRASGGRLSSNSFLRSPLMVPSGEHGNFMLLLYLVPPRSMLSSPLSSRLTPLCSTFDLLFQF